MNIESFLLTLFDAIKFFSDYQNCHNVMVALRWPEGVRCPRCGSDQVTYLVNARVWKCRTKHDSQKFSLKTETIMEDSPIGLDRWLPAIWLITNAKNGISSYELHRSLGVTQKTAWFLLHRIRLALRNGSFEKMSGTVEADETYIGGQARFMHRDKKAKKITGTGGSGKAVVMGLLERHTDPKSKQKVIDAPDYDPKKSKGASRVKVTVVPDTKRETLQTEVRNNVEAGSQVYTDELASYAGLAPAYLHEFANHADHYVRGAVHTNSLENFGALLKRTIKGTDTSVEPFHLFRYLDEQSYRFNERKLTDSERFTKVLGSITDKRLTYEHLTGKDLTQEPLPIPLLA